MHTKLPHLIVSKKQIAYQVGGHNSGAAPPSRDASTLGKMNTTIYIFFLALITTPCLAEKTKHGGVDHSHACSFHLSDKDMEDLKFTNIYFLYREGKREVIYGGRPLGSKDEDLIKQAKRIIKNIQAEEEYLRLHFLDRIEAHDLELMTRALKESNYQEKISILLIHENTKTELSYSPKGHKPN